MKTDLEYITSRPSYNGHTAARLRASARITAESYGRAYIVVTKSVPDLRAGGAVYVTTEPNPSWCAPTALLETVTVE